jgi:hypothetical protein
MATITKQQAVTELIRAVEVAAPDDLVEIYYELFPDARGVEAEAQSDPSVLLGRIRARFAKGLEGEEVLDLWNVIYPKARTTWYDEEVDEIHYHPNGEPVGQIK